MLAPSNPLARNTCHPATTLGGCASAPKLGQPPQSRPAEAYAAALSFAAPSASWPADRWWTAYGDPQLDQLIDEAVAGAPDLARAQARLRQAEAFRQTA